jgi:galactosylceramidase
MSHIVFLVVFLLLTTTSTAIVVSSTHFINLTTFGPVFDGIGAISGGGGETVLLPSYPKTQQQLILDYLFKPSFGAALHILKVEIGGDALSTDGAEPSHMHVENQPPNFHRGYEWWVMKQAKQRNTNIKLYGLPWEWPSWVGDGSQDPYHNLSKPLHYVQQWLHGAATIHNLHLDYIGIWNERQCNPDYVVALRQALDQSGYQETRIVAPDSAIPEANQLLQAMVSRKDLAEAVHAVGYHYPNSNPNISQETLQQLNYKRIWASEDDSSVDPPALLPTPGTPRPRKKNGGGCLVRTINQNYIQGNISSTIVWNLIMARYPQLRWDYTGLMSATDPFEGSFHVLPPVWAAAHTTQFTKPGWKLLPVGSGSGWLDFGGTYVSYTNGEGGGGGGGSGEGDRQLTIVVEKMDANQSSCQRGERPDDQIAVTKAENVTFILSEPMGRANSYTTLVLWSSHFGTSEQQQLESALFVQRDDVPIVNQTVTIEVLPNHAYTLSTVRTATKGGQNKNSNQNTSTLSTNTVGSFPQHYHDDFDKCVLSSLPKYVAPMAGAFECVHAGAGRTGTTSLRQMSPAMSICDRGDVLPYAIIGDGFRTTYNMTMDVLLVSAGGAFVGARTKGPVGSGTGMDGVFLAANSTHWWVALQIRALLNNNNGEIDSNGNNNNNNKVIASGALPTSVRCDANVWCTLSLFVSGASLTASIDAIVVVSNVKVPLPYNHSTATVAGDVVNLGTGGYASFGTVGYGHVEFDGLRLISV